MPANAEQRAEALARRERIVAGFKVGISIAELARLEDVHRRTVREHLKATGVTFEIGRPPRHPRSELTECPVCGTWYRPQASNLARGWGQTHGLSCRMRRRWATGNGISDIMLENASAAAGKNLKAAFKSRWSPDSGRPKSIDDEKVDDVRRLYAKGYSLRQIAERTGIGKSSVQRLVSQNPL